MSKRRPREPAGVDALDALMRVLGMVRDEGAIPDALYSDGVEYRSDDWQDCARPIVGLPPRDGDT